MARRCEEPKREEATRRDEDRRQGLDAGKRRRKDGWTDDNNDWREIEEGPGANGKSDGATARIRCNKARMTSRGRNEKAKNANGTVGLCVILTSSGETAPRLA